VTAFLIIAFVLGTVIGSFINVVIYRVPRSLSVASGRSRCTSCDSTIAPYDLVPIFSALVLRLRCRACGMRFSGRYPAIEFLLGAIWAVLWYFVGSTYGIPTWLFTVVSASILVALAFIDAQWLHLPDGLVLALVVVAFTYHVIAIAGFYTAGPYAMGIRDMLWGALVVSAPLFLVWYSTAGRGLGFGDVKLGAVLGILAGASGGLLILYSACIVGALCGLVLMAIGRATRTTKLPFGTFLCASAIVYLAYGPTIIEQVYLWLR
jgi:leader peptidase (prepilin peptidase) / N-methyltransferase